jgi:rhodanese-related sulfurtransferase
MKRSPATHLVLTTLLAVVACHRTGGTTPPAASHNAPAAELPAVTVEDLSARLARNDGVVVFDVNSRPHYEQRHIPGARWVAFDQVHASDLPSDHGTPLVFYCANEH